MPRCKTLMCTSLRLFAGLSLAAFAPIVAADISSNLEARYLCDGSLGDSSGNGRTLALANGTAAFAANPTDGYACVFDGNTRLKTADGVLPASAAATYAFWIQGAAATGQTLIMQTVTGSTTSNTTNSIDLAPGLLRAWGVNTNFPFSFKQGNFTLGSGWQHVVLTTTGTTGSVQMFVDGQPIASSLAGLNSTTDLRSTFWLGGRSDVPLNSFAGALADVRLYSRALTAADAAELFAQGRPRALAPVPRPAVVPATDSLGLLLLTGLVVLAGFLGLRRS